MIKEEKCRNSQINRIVINKNNKEKRVYKKDLDYYLKDNWLIGQSRNHKKSLSTKHQGKVPWNKGTKNVMHANKTTFNKGHIPWNKGKKNCQQAWNKGLTKEVDERVLKLSIFKKGHKLTEDTKQKISLSHKNKKLSKEQLKIKLSKEYITKKRNNSFNKSKVEENFYKQLLELNKTKTIYRQYKDDNRYPYYCDFYIKEDDLFIELNVHWTHGGRPYDPLNSFCQKQLLEWQQKAKTSQFYKNAIDIWTKRDVEKQLCAKEHNLNYKVIY